MKVRVVDVETTDLGEDAEVCEAAFVDVTPQNGLIHNHDSEIIAGKRPISPEAMGIHHITEEMRERDGCSFGGMHELYRGAEYYCAHNAPFEKEMLGTMGTYNWICTLKCAKHLIPDAPNFQNQTLRYFLDVGHPPDPLPGVPASRNHAHGALYDCYTTAGILTHLVVTLGKTLGELVALTNQPVILKMCTFGKHKGKPWSEVPHDYLMWIRKQGKKDWDDDTWATVQHHLKGGAS